MIPFNCQLLLSLLFCLLLPLATACSNQETAVTPTASPPTGDRQPSPPLLPNDQPPAGEEGPVYSGWVYQAYPDQTFAQMKADLSALKTGGANVVWIGHNNPGEVTENMVEPGLSYAVYQEAQNEQSPKQATAVAIIQAQHQLLQAARDVNLPVVFAIGYHTQMGQTWRQQHPEALRRDAGGNPLSIYGGPATASPYHPDFQADMLAYYQWLVEEFVRPYQDIILMINLADEPLGADYSPAAEAVLQARTGQSFATASAAQLGAFQDQVMVDFAIWSARQWQTLMPGMPVTISFCGAQGRWSYHLPHIEALFRETPPNFVPTFDAYLHDSPPTEPLSEAEVGALLLFARSLGHYSASHGRDLWLWSAGNRWGLAGDSRNPGTIGDAVANGYLLATAVRSTGGSLRGLAIWHTNLRHQGLFSSDPAKDPYDRDQLFDRVNQALPTWRTIMASPAGQTRQLILVSDGWVREWLGHSREGMRGSPLAWSDYLPLTRVETAQAVVGQLPPSLAAIEVIIILDPTPNFLAESDIGQLRQFLRDGGKVLGLPAVTAVIGSSLPGLVELPASPAQLSSTDWMNLLPETAVAQTGFHVSSPEHALYYQPGTAHVPLPPYRQWRLFDSGASQLGPDGTVLQPHGFALAP